MKQFIRSHEPQSGAHLTIPFSFHFVLIRDAQTNAHFGLCASDSSFQHTVMSEHLSLLRPGPCCRLHKEEHTSALVISVTPSARGVPGLKGSFSVPCTGDIVGHRTNHTPTKSQVKRRENEETSLAFSLTGKHLETFKQYAQLTTVSRRIKA